MVGPDFVQWTARHALEVGGSIDEVISILGDIADWVRACYRHSVPAHIRRAILGDHQFRDADFSRAQGEQFVHRPFNADMSLSTVTELSAEWHDAVADNMTGPDSEFPEPWCPGGVSGGFDIVPITCSADLYREGKLMHHIGSWLGVTPFLGAENLLAPRLGDGLKVFPTPMEWLKRERDGVVIVDPAEARWVLVYEQLVVGDVIFARALREKLSLPAPRIAIEEASA